MCALYVCTVILPVSEVVQLFILTSMQLSTGPAMKSKMLFLNGVSAARLVQIKCGKVAYMYVMDGG